MPLLAGWVISAVLWLFKSRIGFMITSVLLWLGINYGTISIVIGPAIELIKGQVEQMGGSGNGQFAASTIAWVRYLGFDKALTMVFSAYVAKHAIAGGRMFLFKRGVGA